MKFQQKLQLLIPGNLYFLKANRDGELVTGFTFNKMLLVKNTDFAMFLWSDPPCSGFFCKNCDCTSRFLVNGKILEIFSDTFEAKLFLEVI